jgi:hypothetical protein
MGVTRLTREQVIDLHRLVIDERATQVNVATLDDVIRVAVPPDERPCVVLDTGDGNPTLYLWSGTAWTFEDYMP